MARKKLTPPTARRRSRSKVRSINFGWWGTIALIVVVGVAAIVFSRGEQASADILREVTIPEFGDAQTVTVSEVHVQPYDRVEADELLFTVTVGGSDQEIGAPVSGIVSEVLATEGAELTPGTRVANVQTGPDFSPANTAGNHWHTALGVYVCDSFLPPIGEFTANLHTHGDGLMHAHPRSNADAGDNGTMGRFFENAGLRLDIDELQYSDGNTYQSGDVDCGGEPGVLQWSLNGEEQDDNPANHVLGNGDVVVLAFVPEGEDFPTVAPSTAGMAENYAQPKHPDFEQPAEAPAEGGAEGEGHGDTADTADADTDTTTTAPADSGDG